MKDGNKITNLKAAGPIAKDSIILNFWLVIQLLKGLVWKPCCSPCVLMCLGCQNKIPQAGWLIIVEIYCLWFWRQRVQDQAAGKFIVW